MSDVRALAPRSSSMVDAAFTALRVTVLSALACALLAVAAGPASAAVGHRYSGQFAGTGTGGGELSGAAGIVVEQSSGDILVAEKWNARVQRFGASGDFDSLFTGSGTPGGALNGPSGVAVDPVSGDIYVTELYGNAVVRFDSSGTYLSRLDGTTRASGLAFAGPTGVAVDPVTRELYVTDNGNNVVSLFSQAGTAVADFGVAGTGAGQLTAPSSVAVDSNSDVYVVDAGDGAGRVQKFTARGAAFTDAVGSPGAIAVAADPVSDEVYVAESSPAGFQVTEYESTGAKISSFGAGRIGFPAGVAVNAATDRVSVIDASLDAVLQFRKIIAPSVAPSAATGVTAGGATLNGTIDDEGVAGTSYHFEYGIDTNYGAQTAETTVADDPTPSAAIADLLPNTTYHYRLVGTNPSGASQSDDQTFTTAPAAPVVDGAAGFADPAGTTTATLHGTVDPRGSATNYHFEYGTTTAYGASTADTDTGSTGIGDTPVTAEVTGLTAGTTYHFRVVANNGTGGDVVGADQTFRTAPSAPVAVSGITAAGATLTGTVNALGASSTYHFEYGTDTTYGTSTPEGNGGGAVGESTVTKTLTDLAPATTYHVRLVATVNGHTVLSDDVTFTTSQGATVTTGDASAITPTSAVLNATIDTHGGPGSYRFHIQGVTTAYTAQTPDGTVTGSQSVSTGLAGLPPGQTFSVRAAVTVDGVTVFGEQVTFTTSAAPLFLPPPPLLLPGENSAPPVPIAVLPPPDTNTTQFTITTTKVSGPTATLSVKAPGPGKLQTSAKNTASTTTTITKASTVKVLVKLSAAGKKALKKAKTKKLKVTVTVKYTPTDGTTTTQTRTITFKRGGAR